MGSLSTYLEEHRDAMEAALASATTAAITARPANPIAFMAAHLRSQAFGGPEVAWHETAAPVIAASADPRNKCLVRYGDSAVLVTDMSGFTKTTRRLGIIHFASLIARASLAGFRPLTQPSSLQPGPRAAT